MFVMRKNRARVIGLLTAYAVLIAGAVMSGSFDVAPSGSTTVGPEAHSPALEARCEVAC